MYLYVECFIKIYLGDSVMVYLYSLYYEYFNILYNCDMMLNLFLFGNINGIIDMVMLGLVGICKIGLEVYEYIDEGLFKCLGLLEWLIVNIVDEYVEWVICLVENY